MAGTESAAKAFSSRLNPAAVSWQIDSFGHSSTTASLFKDLGYIGHFINRVHFKTKEKMRKARTLEFDWILGPSNKRLPTVILHSHYSAPVGLDFESSSISREPTM